ncbi:chain length determinant protein [Streptomyces polygonati]|uniref:Chain length determinant protein n=1 Tax=Streptomyces polygonati TaxID=1617087 RepID=A0ABV8HGV6_9ACTN
MDLAEICRVMGRRWYVLLPGLLLTAVLTVGAYVTVPISYQSQSTVMLLNSQKATVAFDGNPFLSTQTSLTGMADSLARNLNSDASLKDLRHQGATGTSAAKIADNAQGPLMWLTVTGTDQAAVLKSDQLLTDYAKKRLEQFQAQQSVTERAMIRMTTIVPPQNPVAQTKTRLEYLVLAALAGLVISMVATFYVEARRRRPAGRRAAHRSAASEARPSPAGGEEEAADRVAAGPARTAPRWSKEGGSADAGGALPPAAYPDEAAAGTGDVPAVPGTSESDAHRFV